MHAVINAATSGTNEIVAAQPGMTIRVLSYVLIAAGAVVATWKSGTTNKSGAMSLITGVPLSCPASPHVYGNRSAWIETDVGEALNLGLGGAVQVSGHIEYELSRP